MSDDADLTRRFGGVARLYGAGAAARLAGAHVVVAGVGGVGSWAVEALARCGLGRLTLIDLDMVAESNVNRQIQALNGEFGRAKIEVLADRVRAINPPAVLHLIEDFVTPENVAEMIGVPDLLIDAVDDTRAKVAMIAHAHGSNFPVVTAGAAGGRVDPTAVRSDDLARTSQDALLARVRQHLRQRHGFPRDPKKRFGVTAIYSQEAMRRNNDACETTQGGLNCSGYGSSVCVTAAFGLAAAAAAIKEMTGSETR
jgi:tRNA A37 threonylcarbamoyladenosine dehydratase